MERIDEQLLELKDIDTKMEILTKLKEDLRKEIFGYIEDNGLTDGYKNDIATVSYVERKNVKIKDEEKLLQELEEQRLVKYFEVVPEHKELKPTFAKDIREGIFHSELVDVEVTNNLMVKFK